MPLRAVFAALAVVLLTACTSPAGQQPATGSANQQQRTAEQVVTDLVQRVKTVKPGTVFTAETDVNKLLGRPGGYTSKASFTDNRIPADQVIGAKDGAVEYGGSVEVFDTEQNARKRKEYIDSFSGVPLAVEYSWVSGPVLLRVSRVLTPNQAAEYEAALRSISYPGSPRSS